MSDSSGSNSRSLSSSSNSWQSEHGTNSRSGFTVWELPVLIRNLYEYMNFGPDYFFRSFSTRRCHIVLLQLFTPLGVDLKSFFNAVLQKLVMHYSLVLTWMIISQIWSIDGQWAKNWQLILLCSETMANLPFPMTLARSESCTVSTATLGIQGFDLKLVWSFALFAVPLITPVHAGLPWEKSAPIQK